MTFFCSTLGCKVNQYESQLLQQRLEQAGYAAAEDAAADVVIVNSCTVTSESERKTRQLIRRFRKLNRDSIIVLTGCVPQANPSAAEDLTDADIILGHADAARLPALLEDFLRTGARQIAVSSHQRGESMDVTATAAFSGRTRANVKIEDGCNRRCTYCIIPKARGWVRSKPISDLTREVSALAAAGFVEVVLVGINLTAYGQDLGCELCDAVEVISRISEVKRIRLGSLEPDRLSDEQLERLAACPPLCPQFHLSLQSGCNRTLQAMGRQYTAEDFYALSRKIRSLFPDASITTDMMVAFPGESNEDFAASVAFAHEIAFEKIHVFPFSPRQGTPAAAMPGQLPRSIKAERCRQLMAAAQEIRTRWLTAQTGRTLLVLPEEAHLQGGMQGYSANYTPVRVLDATAADRNRLVDVRIIGVEEDSCIGTLLR
ncbi:MAG: tRNA (N(6)-L-threonylcarbamoyladenosine(37)-C(2))-methylthiotransferase MtaB [Oscillospiraceae bacterium]|nr:tRNA (N(6)-L-threonylcarbamoyladenosine(37)-C(2))-methylthiotransferase MtaB [Oscillospiraceae bacterium]